VGSSKYLADQLCGATYPERLATLVRFVISRVHRGSARATTAPTPRASRAPPVSAGRRSWHDSGQRVFGVTDWYRDGTLAEYVAVESRNLAPLPGDVDFTVGASLPISGLTAWQGLFDHGNLRAGQSVLAHGAAGAVGSMVTQLAREAGAYVIGAGRAADRQAALDFGAQEFVDLEHDALEDLGGVDLVFDVIGGDIGKRAARLIRDGGTLVSVVGPVEERPENVVAVDFVVEADRAQLNEIVRRVREGRLRTNIGSVSSLEGAVAAFTSTKRRPGKTIVRVRA
jgi:NADPH:quinone reductase-like Zn-dependent oxidoreductase